MAEVGMEKGAGSDEPGADSMECSDDATGASTDAAAIAAAAGEAGTTAATDATFNISRGPLLPDNPEDTKCYCGKERDLSVPEFQCGMCLRFYHAECIDCTVSDCVPFMTNYQFFCKRCSGQESLNKRPASFSQMCLSSVAFLTQQNPETKYFSKDKDIIPYIEEHWEQLTTGPRRVKQTWHNTIAKTMIKDAAIFTCSDGDTPSDQMFGLTMGLDLEKIGPNCESLFRLTNASYRAAMEQQKPPTAEPKSRGTKRKGPASEEKSVIKHKKGDVPSTRLVPKGYPPEHPYNKDGYRYILATPDVHAPNWQAFDESIEWAGKPIPGYLYRMYTESRVSLAMQDRAPQLKLSEDRLTVTGEKGYSMIRASHGVSYGAWYFEAVITDMPDDSATRIGWSQGLGNLQAPCGYDKFSYSWRSRKGTTFHQSKGKHYADKGFRAKDVIGFYLYMPKPSDPSKLTPPSCKDKPLVKFKSHLYYEEKDYVTETEKLLKPSKKSKLVMYRNGKSQGVAFADIYEGTYYPTVSLFKHLTVQVNFGPKFKYPPKDQKKYKPVSAAAEEAMIQHAMSDMLYHIEHEGQLPEF